MAGGRAPFAVEDSAGIEIVENHAPEHPPGQFWTIDAEPEFVLGGGGMVTPSDESGATVADSAQLIWEVSGLARLEDGRVAVLSTGNLMVESHLASGGDPPAIYISNGDTDEVRQFSLCGDLIRIIRRTTDRVPVTDAAQGQGTWESAFVAYWSQWGDLERELGMTTERFLAGMRREAFPPVAGLVVDAEGFLWVREWSASEVGMPDRCGVSSVRMDGGWA